MAKAPNKKGAAQAASDADEDAALAVATATLCRFASPKGDPSAAAIAVITSWIIERMRLHTTRRLGGGANPIQFDLKGSKVRGRIEATLPQIAASLAHIPGDVPLFKLSKEQVVDVFTAAITAAATAHMATQEDPDDDIPF